MNTETLESEEMQAVLYSIPDFQDEVNILKHVCQNSFKNNDPFVPMYIFYNSFKKKSYLILPPYEEELVEQDPYFEKHSIICHSFAALRASTLLVLECGNITMDNKQYSALKFFVFTRFSAFIYVLPFELDENKEASWLNSQESIQEVMKVDYSQKTKDFVNIANAHVTVEKPIFTAPEIFSYMSYHDYIITPLDDNPVPYFDMALIES
jgi:hypothetical protein